MPFEQELLGCEITWNPQQFGLIRSEDQTEVTGNYYLLSPFDHFAGQDIFHRVTKSIGGDAPPEFSLNSILSDERLKLLSFRTGLDSYGQSSFANWFIPTPVVLESVLVEADLSGIKLRIQSDNHKTLREKLYDDNGALGKILAAVGRYSAIEIESGLYEALASREV